MIVLKEKRDAKIRALGDQDPLTMIDKQTDQKTREIIDRDYSKKESSDPEKKENADPTKKSSRFAHLVERQECWNDEFEKEENCEVKGALSISLLIPGPKLMH